MWQFSVQSVWNVWGCVLACKLSWRMTNTVVVINRQFNSATGIITATAPGAAAKRFIHPLPGATPFGPAIFSNQSGVPLLNLLRPDSDQPMIRCPPMIFRSNSYGHLNARPRLVLRLSWHRDDHLGHEQLCSHEAVFRQRPVAHRLFLPGHDDHGDSLIQASSWWIMCCSDGTFPTTVFLAKVRTMCAISAPVF